ncbi:flagellar filament capping protein FliD [Clostridiaceae bacterium UIB06]|nr:flagellar filament capping protein FliD [Clostridiaceae bacterium UIB06]
MSDVSTTSSAMTGAGGGDKIRLLGMSTGLDVDATVKKMLTGEQSKVDKAKKQQQTIQWKQEAYQDIIKDVKALQGTFFDTNSSDNYILGSKSFAPFSVTSTSGAATVDTSVATFTPQAGAQTGQYSIIVRQLAAGAGVGNTSSIKTSATATPANTTASLSTKLTDIDASLTGNIGLVLNTGGTSDITINLGNEGTSTLGDLVNAINNQSGGKVKATYSELTGKFNLSNTTTGADSRLTIKAGTTANISNIIGTGTIKDDGTSTNDAFGTATNAMNAIASDISLTTGSTLRNTVLTDNTKTLADVNSSLSGTTTLVLNVGGSNITINLDSTTKLSDLASTIQTQSGGAITASCDANGFNLKATSDTATLKIVGGTSGTTSGLLTIFGLTTGDGTPQEGKNADVSITPPGGTAVPVTNQSTNNFTIDGMNYTLSGVSPKDASSNPIATSVNVGSDTSKVYDKINDFVTKYNVIIDKIQARISEKKDKNYSPLTDAQKSSMSESQITAWETKAKVGVLRNDDNLQTMLNDLRAAFNASVSNTGLSFGQYGSNAIGIDFSNDPTQPGHIEIADATKLKAAIANYPDKIAQMFTNVSTKTDGKTKYTSSTDEYKEDGIFKRVKTIFEKNVGFTNTTLNTATLTIYANKQYDFSSTGSGGKGTIPDQLYEQQLMVKKLTTHMSAMQERYYKQFSALETAMTTLNAQQSQLSSMLGG